MKEKSALLSVEFETPFGPVRGRVNIATGPMRLADLVPTALELTDILVDRARRKMECEGGRISCRSGCGVCCSQMVPLSPPEAFYLVDMIVSLDPDRRKEVLGRFDEIVNTLKQNKMIDELMDPVYTDEPVLSIAREYFYLRMACPFLIHESCGIYEHRPVACREYNVTSPPEYCNDPYAYKVEKVPMPLPMSAPLARIAAELTGSMPRLIPLTLAPFWVAGYADLRQGQWPGLELFQRFMAIIGKPR
jgi:Fe-S-cluster containining protein